MTCKQQKWIQYFEARGDRAIAINSFEGKGMQAVTKAAKEILEPKIARMRIKRNSTRRNSGNDCRHSKRWKINTY